MEQFGEQRQHAEAIDNQIVEQHGQPQLAIAVMDDLDVVETPAVRGEFLSRHLSTQFMQRGGARVMLAEVVERHLLHNLLLAVSGDATT